MSLAKITSLRRQLQEWAQRAGNQKFLRDDQLRQLDRVLGDPTRRTQALVAAWMLGSWQLGNGMLRVLDGDAEGFDEAREGQGLRRAALLTRIRQDAGLRRGRQRLSFSLQHGAWTCLLGLALHDPGAEPLYEFVQQLPDIQFSEKDHLAFFTRELLTLRSGRRVSLNARLGPFEPVLSHWSGDDRLLGRDLIDLLDWHLTEARSGGDLDDPACRLYPLEVFALQHVREWLELGTPKVDHPLMHTNLGTMRPRTPWPQSALVQRVERLARS